MTDFRDVADRFGFGDTHPRLQALWADSLARFEDERPAFPDPAALAEGLRWVDLPAPFVSGLPAAVDAIRRDGLLVRYLWHCRRLISGPESEWPGMGAGFPVIRPESAPGAGMGYALVVLDLLPEAADRFRRRGIPEAIARDTFTDLGRWVEEYRKAKGGWGLSNLGWLQHHLRARIFALGRLQFRLETFGLDFHGWREEGTGRFLLLAGDGMQFRPDGQFANADGASEHFPGVWIARYGESAGRVAGCPVDPRGHVRREPVVLPKAGWRRVLGIGDRTVGIHIPSGGPMDFNACGESFGRVKAFFDAHLPDYPFRFLTCGSWLLDPRFEGRLPETSNTVRFLRELYLHPHPGASDAGLVERAFGGRRFRAGDRQDGFTTLQRAVAGLIEEGGTWRSGCALLPVDGLQWGRSPFRTMWTEESIQAFQKKEHP